MKCGILRPIIERQTRFAMRENPHGAAVGVPGKPLFFLVESIARG
jgi:hypothetical protein